MKKLLSIFFVLWLGLATPSYAFLVGIDFRNTAGFVTDPANYCNNLGGIGGASAYPQNCAGTQTVKVGWTENAGPTDGGRDRSSSVADKSLAGQNGCTNSGTQCHFRVDVPSPRTYQVCMAAGDETTTQGYQYVSIGDGTSTPGLTGQTNIQTGGTANAVFMDSLNNKYSDTTWRARGSCYLTYVHSYLIFTFGATSAQSNDTTIASIEVSDFHPPLLLNFGGVYLLGGKFLLPIYGPNF